MKLPQLLSHFLYQNKILALPGIGVFTLDASVVLPGDEQNKDQPLLVQGVGFEQVQVTKADSTLIDFIHQYTGKMRTLAESDLDSYLRLGIQLLNIGKPFYLDGIGSIVKSKEGKYEFVPGEYSSVRLSLPNEEKAESADRRKKLMEEQEQETASPRSARLLMIVGGVLISAAIIAWAGYSLYKRKAAPAESNMEVVSKDSTPNIKSPDSTVSKITQSDSAVAKKAGPVTSSPLPVLRGGDTAMYKFVILATSKKNRALRRYNQLISFQLNVKLDTRDSSFFKIYFPIYTTPKDTLHIKDSLNEYYATQTLIEK